MNIAEQLTLLAELNQIELKIRGLNDRLDQVPKDAAAARDVADGKKKVLDAIEQRRFQVERERQAKERDLHAERDHLKKWKLRLDNIRDEREHTALLSEIGTLKRVIQRMENDILEKMEAIEEHDKEIAAAKEAFDNADTYATQEWNKVAGEVDGLEKEKSGAESGRANFIDKLPDSLVKRYRRVADKRAGQGVALIKGETCAACNTVLPPQLCLMVWKGELLEGCPSCSRILVHEQMTMSQAVEAAHESAAQ